MNAEPFPHTPSPGIIALIAGLAVAAAILSLPAALLTLLVSGSGLASILSAVEPPLDMGTRVALAATGGVVAGLVLRITLGFFMPESADGDDYDIFRDDGPILRPIFAATDLGAPFGSIRADAVLDLGALPFEDHPVAAGDAEPVIMSGRMLWEPDPWFDAMQDPEPALIQPVRWGAPVLEAVPIATLSLTELVARLEAGLHRRKAIAAAAPVSAPAPRTAAYSPVRDMDDALRDALGTLQRLAARSG